MDKLRIPAYQFYNNKGYTEFCEACKAGEHKGLDHGGRALSIKAHERKYMSEARRHSFNRRTYSPDYLTRSEDGKKMYLDNFEQLGPRWVKDACAILNPRDGHNGWYTSDFGETLAGVVLCFTRHGEGDEDNNTKYPNTKAKGRVIYMAGTRHSDWDGVTLDLDTTDDPDTAARWADDMAEREAERCREEEEKYQAEQQAEREAEEAIEEEHFT